MNLKVAHLQEIGDLLKAIPSAQKNLDGCFVRAQIVLLRTYTKRLAHKSEVEHSMLSQIDQHLQFIAREPIFDSSSELCEEWAGSSRALGPRASPELRALVTSPAERDLHVREAFKRAHQAFAE